MSRYRDQRALVLVTASTQEPVSRIELKRWAKVDEDESVYDAELDRVNTAARQRIESETGRSLITQTFDQYLDCFPSGDCPLELDRSPLVSVSSVRGFATSDITDTGGVAMSSSGWYLDTANEPGRLVPASGFTWPSATRLTNAGIVRFTAGYSSGTSGVPSELKLATQALAAYWFEHRGDEALDDATTRQRPLPTHVRAILEDYAMPEWG